MPGQKTEEPRWHAVQACSSWFKAVNDGEDVRFMAGSHVRRCNIFEYWWQVPRVCRSRSVRRVHLLNCERQIGLGISLFPCQFVNCFPQLPGASRLLTRLRELKFCFSMRRPTLDVIAAATCSSVRFFPIAEFLRRRRYLISGVTKSGSLEETEIVL